MWAIEHQDDQAALAQAADMFDALIARSAMLLAQSCSIISVMISVY